MLDLCFWLFFYKKKYYKQKEDEGFCIEAGRRLSDDELYQAAIMNWIHESQEKQEDLPKTRRFCRYAENCKVWMIKEPLSIPQIKQKMELSWNKSASEIIKIFGMQAVDNNFALQHLRQNSNRLTLADSFGTGFVFIPSDCCEVLSVVQVAELKEKYQDNKRMSLNYTQPEIQPTGRRYLRYKRFYPGIQNRINDGYQDGLIGVYGLDGVKSSSLEQELYFPLSSCGKIISN